VTWPPGYRPERIDVSTCPFEAPWRARRLEPAAAEPPRAGEGGTVCGACGTADAGAIWANERWRLRSKEETSIPGTVILETHEHFDSFASLPPAHLAEFGPLAAAVESCLLALGGVSRVHISRWGDGSSHFHVYFYPRPRGVLQLRGTFLAIWELLLPPADDEKLGRAEAVIAAGMQARYPKLA
jgi:diadenosine tetraphosphate (Ap4A) HIT family hydrolase